VTQLSFESRLFSIAAQFTSPYHPYQGVCVYPGPGGQGAIVSATHQGSTLVLAFDPAGEVEAPANLLPYPELARAAKGLKNGARTLEIDTETRLAKVITHLKTKAGKVVELPAPAELPIEGVFLDMRERVAGMIRYWKEHEDSKVNAGRYDIKLLTTLLDSAESLGESIVLSCLDGPLRISIDGSDLFLIIGPQTAEPIPPVPAWMARWAASGEPVD
jgi:hypothetical protein